MLIARGSQENTLGSNVLEELEWCSAHAAVQKVWNGKTSREYQTTKAPQKTKQAKKKQHLKNMPQAVYEPRHGLTNGYKCPGLRLVFVSERAKKNRFKQNASQAQRSQERR
eukprot:TRINITY_DN66811_c0_g1_i1.p1 TRINITY_DN66811_c0_g1~~TRINITY_DN66811_c0_g1_i1.p1  ORF type:complete len:111 (+),score=4.15 TRINITY_DN66811_c0_g1_i1:92-424(+)